MAKRQRRDRSGVGAKHGRLYVTFTWKGIRCKEYVNDADTPENRKKWADRVALIKAEIRAERFEYRAWFPNGTKLGIFYPEDDPATGKKMTLRAWLEKWHARRSPFRKDGTLMPDADLHPTTWLHNGTVLKAWFRDPKFRIADLQLTDVTTSACLDFKRSLADRGLSGKTVLNRMGLLHKALQDAVEERLITSNPVPKLASSRKYTNNLRKQSKPLAVEEVQRFLDKLPGRANMAGSAYVSGKTLRDLYLLWFRTGWRSNEVVALRFDWLSPSRHVVELRKGRAPRLGGLEAAPKTGEREVVCDYDPAIFEMFERRRRESLAVGTREYVFTDSLGRPLSQEWLAKRVWHPTLRMIGLSARGQYNIRDTFITLALSAGEDPGWVAQVCGTSEEMIFRHYRTWMPSLRRGHGRALVGIFDEDSAENSQDRPKIGPEIGPGRTPRRRKCREIKGLEEWRRGESNPRPKAIHNGFSVRSLVFWSRLGSSH